MADDLTLAMRLYTDARRWVSGLNTATSGTRKFVSTAKKEFSELTAPLRSLKGQLAGIGAGFVATQQIMQSARLDKSLTQIGLTAGVADDRVAELREELFNLSQETGRPIAELEQGFNNLIQSGQSWDESLRIIIATNKAMAVTNAQAGALTGGLTVAAEAFDFDLSKPKLALNLLDSMTVAGRLGNAELENLSSIFARVGVNAKSAKFGFDDTLAFIEGLSLIERNPERLATLADSTIRLFTNLRYLRAAQGATGVRFFDESDGRRNPLDVLRDLRAEFQKLDTDAQRASFVQTAFGSADLDTQRGLRALLEGQTLTKIQGFTGELAGAAGTLDRDLDDAINNAVDQVGRLQAALTEAVDKGFAKPINKTISEAIKFGLASKEEGGLGLSGGEIIGGGLALTAGTLLASRYGGKALKKFGGKFFGLGAGVATGKALEEVAGVTPVYVVGAAPGVFSGSGGFTDAASIIRNGGIKGISGKSVRGARAAAGLLGGTGMRGIAAMGAGALTTSGAALLAAGAAGYGAGTFVINPLLEKAGLADDIGEAIASTLAAFGLDEAQAALAANKKAGVNVSANNNAVFTALMSVLTGSAGVALGNRLTADSKGELKISVSDDRVRVVGGRALPGLDFDIRNGPPMVMY